MAVNTQVLISFAKNCGASCKHPLVLYQFDSKLYRDHKQKHLFNMTGGLVCHSVGIVHLTGYLVKEEPLDTDQDMMSLEDASSSDDVSVSSDGKSTS